jgi:hypothetical protein
MGGFGRETFDGPVYENDPDRQSSMAPLANEQRVCVPLHRKKHRFGFECGQRASCTGASPLLGARTRINLGVGPDATSRAQGDPSSFPLARCHRWSLHQSRQNHHFWFIPWLGRSILIEKRSEGWVCIPIAINLPLELRCRRTTTSAAEPSAA